MFIKSEHKKEAQEKLNMCKTAGMKLMQTEDFQRADLITQNIDSYNLPKQEQLYQFNPVKEFYLAANLLKIYQDKKIISEINLINMPENRLIHLNPHNVDNFSFLTRVDFSDEFEDSKYQGIVSNYTVPLYINRFSHIFLAHEFNHALKDTNYQEFLSLFIAGEVIPLFFELITLDNFNTDIKKNFLQTRMAMMSNNCQIYYEAKTRINENEEIFNFIKSDAGKYANALYLALLLYNMYRKNPKQVLEEVKKVLYQKQTTIELLNKLGIYNIKNSNIIVTNELNKIHKLITNKRR